MEELDPYQPPQTELTSPGGGSPDGGDWRSIRRCWVRRMSRMELALVDIERQPLLWLRRPSFLSRAFDLLLPGEPRQLLGLRFGYHLGFRRGSVVVRDEAGVLAHWERGSRAVWSLVDARDRELIGATITCERMLLVFPRRAILRDREEHPQATLYRSSGSRLLISPRATLPREVFLPPLVMISLT